jgi:WhiB family redox-sensing transcriptional regulator
MSWRQRAACAGLDTNLFFPSEKFPDPKIPRARAVCAICPVWEDCLSYALENPTLCGGIWGGLTERERRRQLRLTARRDDLAGERARWACHYVGLPLPADVLRRSRLSV